MIRLLPVFLLACTGPGSGAIRTDSGPSSPATGSGGPTVPTVEASCTRDADNALRVWCDIETTPDATAQVTLSAPGVPTRSFVHDVASPTHRILAWGLKPSTDYTWSVGAASGVVSTGSPPLGFRDLEVSVSGTLHGIDAILQPLDCGLPGFAMFDGEGDVIWYEPSTLFENNMDGYEWSQADRSLLVTNGQTVHEVHVSGDIGLQLTDFEGRAHHDLARWGDLTYVLFDAPFAGMNVDGIHVFDGTSHIASFRLQDHFTIEGTGVFGNDWSHANAINPTGDGHLILSLLAQDSVLSLDMDPASPGFLGIDWIAAGTDDNLLPGTTYTAPIGPGLGFDRQHNASVQGDVLTLFDNDGDPSSARAARYQLDDQTGSVTLLEAWPMDASCPVQGGAIVVGERVLASCAATRDVRLFESGSPDPVFQLQASCPGGDTGVRINRGIPVWVE